MGILENILLWIGIFLFAIIFILELTLIGLFLISIIADYYLEVINKLKRGD